MRFLKWSMVLFLALGVVGCGEDDDEEESTFTLTGAGSSDANLAGDGDDPEYLNILVYKVAISTSSDCSSPITVFEDADPDYMNILENPTFGSDDMPEDSDGDYPCVILEMSDTIQYAPEDDNGACTAGEDEELDVCNVYEEAPTSQLIDGTTVTCTDGEDRVALYLSTLSIVSDGGDEEELTDEDCADEDDCNAFLPPSTSITTRGFTLGNQLSVSGDTTAVFIVDGTGQIESRDDEDGEICEMGPPSFSFSKSE